MESRLKSTRRHMPDASPENALFRGHEPIFLLGGVHLYGSLCFIVFGLIYWFLVHSAYMLISNCIFGGLCILNWFAYLKIRKEGQRDTLMATVFLSVVYFGIMNIIVHLGKPDSPLMYWGISIVIAAAFIYPIWGILSWLALCILLPPISLFLKRNWLSERAIPLDHFQTELLNDASYLGILLFLGYMFYLFQKKLTRTLEDLEQSELFLIQAQKVANLGVYNLDLKTDRWSSSETLDHILGIDPLFLRTVTGWSSLIHPEDRQMMLDYFQNEVLGKQLRFNKEYRFIRHNDREVRWVHGQGELEFSAQGQPLRMIGTIQDITARKQSELELVAAKNSAENAAQSKAKFLDTAAHELRTPITVFSLLLQFIQKQLDSGQPVRADTFARLREPADRLTRLVVDLLDVSRLERGFLILRRVRSDLTLVVANCLREFELQAPERRFIFIKPEKPIEMDFDPLRINQVLSNLLDNAVKYTPRDCPIEVTIETTATVVRVSVIDHGAGIPKERHAELFKAFSRGGTEATVQASGLGLGLSVCRGIMQLHGGSIHILSEASSGSTFYFELPRSG